MYQRVSPSQRPAESIPEFDLAATRPPSKRETALEERVRELEGRLVESEHRYESRIHQLETQLQQKDREIQALRMMEEEAPRKSTYHALRAPERQVPVSLPAALIVEDRGERLVYYGRATALALDCVSVYFDHNILCTDTAQLLLDIPPETQSRDKHLVEVECSVLFTILASNGQGFRSEIGFSRFKRGSKTLLRNFIARREQATSQF